MSAPNPVMSEPVCLHGTPYYNPCFACRTDRQQMKLDALRSDLAACVSALQAIESGAVYIDGKPGATPKTRAREALAAIGKGGTQ